MAMLFAATAPERVGALMLYASMARMSWARGLPVGLAHEAREAGHGRHRSADWGGGTLHVRRAGRPATPTTAAWWRGWAGCSAWRWTPRYARKVTALNGAIDVRPVLPRIQAPTLVLHRRRRRGLRLPPLGVPRRAHPQRAARRARGRGLAAVPGRQRGGPGRDRGVPHGRPRRARARPRPGHRALHRHLRVHRARRRARRRALADAARAARRRRARAARPPPRPGRSRPSATASWPRSTGRPAAIRAARGIAEDVEDLGLEIRAGLHTGECEVIGDDVGGIAVHIAARVMAGAEPRRGARLQHRQGPRGRLRAATSTTAASTSCAASRAPGACGRSRRELRHRRRRGAATGPRAGRARPLGSAASGPSRRSPRARAGWRARCTPPGVRARGRRPDADRQPAAVGRWRWSPASARATSCCRATSSCARRTCARGWTITRPAAVVADPRNAEVLREAGWTGPTLWEDEAPAPPARRPRRPRTRA